MESDSLPGTIRLVRRSLHLLAPRDRIRLWLLTGIQMTLGVLDLLGVAAVAVVTAQVLSSTVDSESGAVPQAVSWLPGPLSVFFRDHLAWALLGAAGLLVIRSILTFALTRRTLTFLAFKQVAIADRLSKALLSQDLSFIQRRSSQETAYALMAGVQQATMGVLAPASMALAEISLLVILGVGLLNFDWIVTVGVAVFFGAIAIVLHRASANWAIRFGLRSQRVDIESLSSLQDLLGSYREITVAGRKGYFQQKFMFARATYTRTQASQATLALLPRYSLEISMTVGLVILGVYQYLTSDPADAFLSVAIFLTAGSRILPSIVRLQSAGLAIHGASAMATRTLELNAELIEQANAAVDSQFLSRPASSSIFSPVVQATGLEYTYPGGSQPVLRNVNFECHPGEFVAIAGASGAGKSTLADLILGLVKPTAGKITISGVSPMQAFAVWPGSVAYVSQSSHVTSGTITSNVCMGLAESEIDLDRIYAVLDQVQLLSVIQRRNGGLDSEVGEGGLSLSGGERQRLGLARALYLNPRLLLLDEATSSLDPVTEEAISRTLQCLRGSTTLVTIAHRLSTIATADRIYYLRRGEVAGEGTYGHLQTVEPEFLRQVRLAESWASRGKEV